MQILAVSDSYAPRVCERSGALRALLQEIRAKGHAVTLIAPDCGDDTSDPAEDVIRVSVHPVPIGRRSARIMKMRRILELTERLRGWRYDVVHIHTPFIAHLTGVALARRLGVPCLQTWHTFYDDVLSRHAPFLPRAWLDAASARLSRYQCERVDGVVVPSESMQARLQAYGVQRPIAVIPAAIDVQLFQRGDGARFRATHGIAPARPLLMHAGRMTSADEWEFLLQVLRDVRTEIPDVLLGISGGARESFLRTQVERLDLAQHVVFVGDLQRPEGLLDCYRAADGIVFVSNGHAQGVALLEALAAGVPVVAAATPGTQDILAGECGVLLAQDNLADFTAQVLRALRDADLRARMTGAARQHVQRWSASLAAEQLIDCYRELISTGVASSVRALAR